GDRCPAPEPVPARLVRETKAPADLVELARARLRAGPASPEVELIGAAPGRSAAGLAGLAAADALACLRSPDGRLAAGSVVPVLPFAWL
ncbi:MAG TPA: hypothetical protein VFS00_20560, partial [Polyangiaceae bacterium]|nr:hypothetical protein [Polyangiaceae bacterium]